MITVNGMPLEKYLGLVEVKERKQKSEEKGREIQQFIRFELRAMRRPGLRHQVIETKPVQKAVR